MTGTLSSRLSDEFQMFFSVNEFEKNCLPNGV